MSNARWALAGALWLCIASTAHALPLATFSMEGDGLYNMNGLTIGTERPAETFSEFWSACGGQYGCTGDTSDWTNASSKSAPYTLTHPASFTATTMELDANLHGFVDLDAEVFPPDEPRISRGGYRYDYGADLAALSALTPDRAGGSWFSQRTRAFASWDPPVPERQFTVEFDVHPGTVPAGFQMHADANLLVILEQIGGSKDGIFEPIIDEQLEGAGEYTFSLQTDLAQMGADVQDGPSFAVYTVITTQRFSFVRAVPEPHIGLLLVTGVLMAWRRSTLAS